MSALREQLLLAIYGQFGRWALVNSLHFACQKGCSTCCTSNVTITAVEGDFIHRFIKEQDLHSWFADKLMATRKKKVALETTNELAAKCLSGKESSGTAAELGEVCPFLDKGCCRIYQVRPFMCRSFASARTCLPGQAAELPEFYITATTAALQLIEHVGQGEYWGNMHDVLLALCDLKENEETAGLLDAPSMADQARARLRKAIPLPGFLISAEDYDKVIPFISAVFNQKIGGKTVETILNGK